VFREENREKDEQLQLLSGEQKMKNRYARVLTLKPKKGQLFLAVILAGDTS